MIKKLTSICVRSRNDQCYKYIVSPDLNENYDDSNYYLYLWLCCHFFLLFSTWWSNEFYLVIVTKVRFIKLGWNVDFSFTTVEVILPPLISFEKCVFMASSRDTSMFFSVWRKTDLSSLLVSAAFFDFSCRKYDLLAVSIEWHINFANWCSNSGFREWVLVAYDVAFR